MHDMCEKKAKAFKLFSLILILLSFFLYKCEGNFGIGDMSFEETDTEESSSSLNEMSSLDDDFGKMYLEFESSDEEVTNDEVDSNVWNEIKPESDEEFMEEHDGLVEEVTSISEDDAVNPVDCYRHFVTDEIIDLIVRETNRYAEQYLQTHEVSRRSKFHQWKPITNEEMGLVQMPKLKYYWSSSQLYGLEIIRNTMSREREREI